ncbi:hypothetical protein thsrh120_53290 [Rhizobium sp. No.120]
MRAMRALTLRASVRIEPLKPFSVEVKVPMVAIVVFLSLVSGRALRGLDGCRKDRRRSDRTRRDGMEWRAAWRNFVVS